MATEFTRSGFNADYLEGDHDQAHRDAVLARLKAGDLQVVFSVDVLGEGIDVPDVDTLLLLRPTQSPVLFAQQLGRGLRTAPGKIDLPGPRLHRPAPRGVPLRGAVPRASQPGAGKPARAGRAEFPFLPAGCSITLERVARERVLARLKEVTPRAGLTGLKKDLASDTAKVTRGVP